MTVVDDFTSMACHYELSQVYKISTIKIQFHTVSFGMYSAQNFIVGML